MYNEVKIKGFEEYTINENGEVFSIVYRNQNGVFNRHRKLKTQKNGVMLRKGNKNYRFKIDNLVAKNFLDNPHGYKYIKHIDGNITNNHYQNLEWVKNNPIYNNKLGFENISFEGYKFHVIEFIDYFNVIIQFDDEYKIKVKTQWKECESGNIRNPYHKSILGVACLGLDKNNKRPKTSINSIKTREYEVWRGILDRCYNTKSNKYKYYGGKGVRICDRWLVFANFLEDLPQIENYDKWKESYKKYHLDKDTKSNGIKIYSPETCIFLTVHDNVVKRNEDNGLPIKPCKKIVGINKNTNEKIIFNNIHEVVDKLEIKSKSNVYFAINNPQRTCKGYYFKWYDGGDAL